MISVVIAYKDDFELIEGVVSALSAHVNPSDVEIIISDDGSDYPIPTDVISNKAVRIVRSSSNDGVGCAFDKGVASAKGDTLVLMGSDVYVNPITWYDDVIWYSGIYANTLMCTACAIHEEGYLDKEPNITGYGAEIAWIMGGDPNDDLGKAPTRESDIIQARWLRSTEGVTTEIPCILGAFYITDKAFYNKIGGFSGHIGWGGLEPHISIKAWLSGGRCVVIPDMVTWHVFSKFRGSGSIFEKRPIRHDLYYYNKMFIAETMISNPYRQKLLSHLLPNNAVGMAKRMIERDYDYIRIMRDETMSRFSRDITYLFTSFGGGF